MIYVADQTPIYQATHGDAPADRSQTVELHNAAHLGTTTEADQVLVQRQMLAATGAFGLKRVREREVETWDGRSTLTQLPSEEGRTRVLSCGLHLGQRSRAL